MMDKIRFTLGWSFIARAGDPCCLKRKFHLLDRSRIESVQKIAGRIVRVATAQNVSTCHSPE